MHAMIEGGGGGGGNNEDDDESLLSKLNPFKALKKAQQKAAIEKRKQDANKVISDDMRTQLFGEGLMGKMAAGMINNVAGALREQMSEAAEKSQDCYDAATRAVGNDSRVRRYLGDGVQCTPPMSQMSSSMNVNGGGRGRGRGRNPMCGERARHLYPFCQRRFILPCVALSRSPFLYQPHSRVEHFFIFIFFWGG